MKKRQSVRGNNKIPMQITAMFIPQDKFIDFFPKWSLGNVNSRNLQQSRITSWFMEAKRDYTMSATKHDHVDIGHMVYHNGQSKARVHFPISDQ